MTMQELAIYLAFEQGKIYERIYTSLGLYNAIDFNNIAFANGCGAQWHLKGNMNNLPEIIRCHITSQHEETKIEELNKIVENIRFLQALPLDN